MLNEGRRRRDRGTDVVVALLETHGRERTAREARDLEVIPRLLECRPGEMDVQAVLRRQPQVALVDELAHQCGSEGGQSPRWQEVSLLLEAGIDVISTLNIEHLESLADVVAQITGAAARETIPDVVVRSAARLELIDMAPEALRRRLAHGSIYPPEQVDAALGDHFRLGNLAALRELALLWVADRVDESLERYKDEHGISERWETRERVVVGVSAEDTDLERIRRASRMALRNKGDLLAVHVQPPRRQKRDSSRSLQAQRELVTGLGGTFHEIRGRDTASSLLAFCRAQRATRLVVGVSSGSRRAGWLRRSVLGYLFRGSDQIDLHVISHPAEPGHRVSLPRWSGVFWVGRRGLAWGLGVILVVAAVMAEPFGVAFQVLAALAPVMAVMLVFGPLLALAAAGVAIGAAAVIDSQLPHLVGPGVATVVVLAIVILSGAVAVVHGVTPTSRWLRRSEFEAEALARTAAHLRHGGRALDLIVEELRRNLSLKSVAVLARTGGGWSVLSAQGADPPRSPDEADESLKLPDGLTVAVSGQVPKAADQRLLQTTSVLVGVAAELGRLEREAREAADLVANESLHGATLAAVSHDLRTPLASIKAAASSLLDKEVRWTAEAEHELLATISSEADRLGTLVGNLLDISRLRTGAVTLTCRPLSLYGAVAGALAGRHDPAGSLRVRVPETLLPVLGDPTLLERAIANVVDNALKWSPPDRPAVLEAGVVRDQVILRVVDHGPGIAPKDRLAVFRPFQRLGDSPRGTGVGLGLAVARGFMSAMGGSLEVEDTPGGGCTMVFRLPVATYPACPEAVTTL
jgi:two-component system sensor histidine kinase KdpD